MSKSKGSAWFLKKLLSKLTSNGMIYILFQVLLTVYKLFGTYQSSFDWIVRADISHYILYWWKVFTLNMSRGQLKDTCWGKSNLTNHVEIKMITFHLENLNFRKGSALIILKRQHYINSNAMNTFGWRYWLTLDTQWTILVEKLKLSVFFNFLSEPQLFM